MVKGVYFDRTHLIETLIEAGADLNIQDNGTIISFTLETYLGNLDTLNELLNENGNNAINGGGLTALMYG